ncbi:FASCICLIN-like arabinogalactan protein 16 precursor [Perilla frutescens var. hirtella]|uniref:FASCICLIN-like arabinogalactan protein 16 n=1 Tax=Perilla frutescens var. hirtella TaxID=608512 RepID=A0AAD4JF25_PERFH|nr:FASCICLIN-like arabinogalactan protein 16 precursor [Perilla frutescens var. hirtella]
MGQLVFKLKVLPPNDEAMVKLATNELSEPRASEKITYYHLIPEYKTEESVYNAVKRSGKGKYDNVETAPSNSAMEKAL